MSFLCRYPPTFAPVLSFPCPHSLVPASPHTITYPSSPSTLNSIPFSPKSSPLMLSLIRISDEKLLSSKEQENSNPDGSQNKTTCSPLCPSPSSVPPVQDG